MLSGKFYMICLSRVCNSTKPTPLKKYLQNYEISERSRRIVVLRSHIPKNQGKKRESVANCNIDVGWYWLHEYSMKDKKSRNFAPR